MPSVAFTWPNLYSLDLSVVALCLWRLIYGRILCLAYECIWKLKPKTLTPYKHEKIVHKPRFFTAL